MDLDVTDLKAGTHDVPVTVNLPAGTTLVGVEPADREAVNHQLDRGHRAVTAQRRRPSREADRWPAFRHRRDPRRRQRRPEADPGLRPRPGGRASARRPRRRARRRPGHASLGRHVRGGHRGRRDEPRASTSTSSVSSRPRPWRSWPGTGRSRPGSWSRPRTTRPTTTGSRSSTATGSSSTTRSRTSWSGSSGGPRARRRPERRARPDGRARGRLDDYRAHRLGLASTIDAGGLRLVLDCRERLGLARWGREILEATGARVDVIHAEPDGININVESGATAPASLAEAVVARRRRRRVRARRRRRPADRGGRDRTGRRRRPGPRDPGPRPA